MKLNMKLEFVNGEQVTFSGDRKYLASPDNTGVKLTMKREKIFEDEERVTWAALGYPVEIEVTIS